MLTADTRRDIAAAEMWFIITLPFTNIIAVMLQFFMILI